MENGELPGEETTQEQHSHGENPDADIPVVTDDVASSAGDERNEVIALMQAQIDLQGEKITKHEALIEELISQVQDLKLLLVSKKTECNASTGKTAESDWTSSTSKKASTVPMSIADMVKETAESTVAQSGFVYDPNSGLYYDQTSGMYYDSVRGLYYNGHTRTYYTIDAETQQYLFHSQLPPLEPEEPTTTTAQSRKVKRKSKPKVKAVEKSKEKAKSKAAKVDRVVEDEIEDGELSSSSSVSIIEQVSASSDSDASHGTVVLDDEDEDEDIGSSKEQAPCIRAIVLESPVAELKKGFLFLVTCTGGTIGREGSQHTILISDPMISKNHAQITYDFEEVSITDNKESSPMRKTYLISDLGSQNGTILNGIRLSMPLLYSEPREILHGSTLQLGGTKLLLHIHPGQLTCANCEPGLILVKEPMYGGFTSKKSTEALRKKNMKQLRRKYGIEPYQMAKVLSPTSSYKDRAGERRQTKGSDNPFEKTAVASLDEAIKEDNKGFKMMAKMGWSSGDSLGQTKDSGIREPVKIEFRLGRAGLGASTSDSLPIPTRHNNKKGFHDKNRTDVLQKTIQRFTTASQLTTPETSKPKPSSSKESKSKKDIIEID